MKLRYLEEEKILGKQQHTGFSHGREIHQTGYTQDKLFRTAEHAEQKYRTDAWNQKL